MGEEELGLTVGELLIHRRVGLELVLDVVLVLGVQVHLEQAGAVDGDAHALAHDVGGAADVLEHGLVHFREGTGHGADVDALALVVEAEHGALGDEHHVLLGELLLELADEAGLDALHGGPAAEGHEGRRWRTSWG